MELREALAIPPYLSINNETTLGRYTLFPNNIPTLLGLLEQTFDKKISIQINKYFESQPDRIHMVNVKKGLKGNSKLFALQQAGKLIH